MEKKESWHQRNPLAISKIQKRYYEKNKEKALFRSKLQNLRGKLSYLALTKSQKKKIDKEVERLLQNNA
tara:strand:+ start:160 stop:366 length:207 start_codon:yes stop_codon:yes gene_type:complete